MKKVLLIILASMFSFSQANSADFSVGIAYNESAFSATGTEDEYNESGVLDTSTREHGAFSEGFGSIFFEAGNDQGAIGIEVSDSFKTPKAINEFNTSGTNNTTEVEAEFESYIQLYGRLNIPLGGLYAKAGITMVDIKTIETTKSGNSYPDTDTTGYTAGIGWDQDMGNGFSLRAEVTAHTFDDVSVDNGKGTSGNLNKISISNMWGATGKVAIVKTF